MKRTALIFLLFTSFFCVAQKQFNYRAIYDLVYKTDSTTDNIKRDQLILLMSDNKESFFQSYNQFKKDSTGNPDILAVGSFVKEIIVIENTKKNINIHRSFDNINTYYEESIPDKWKLKNAESSVNGIKCKQATLKAYGRNWTACYSEDYPFQFGPYLFAGLPGLILSVEDDQKYYQFKLSSIKKENNVVADTPKAKEVSKIKFYELVYEADFSGKFFNNFRMETPEQHEEFRKKYLEAVKRKNTVPIDKSMRYLFNK